MTDYNWPVYHYSIHTAVDIRFSSYTIFHCWHDVAALHYAGRGVPRHDGDITGPKSHYYTVYYQIQLFLQTENKTAHVPECDWRKQGLQLPWLLSYWLDCIFRVSRHKGAGSVCPERPWSLKRCTRALGRGGGAPGSPGSQGDPGTVVLELAGQHAAVQLIKLHQLDQVCELCVTLVQAVEQVAFIVHLHAHHTQRERTQDKRDVQVEAETFRWFLEDEWDASGDSGLYSQVRSESVWLSACGTVTVQTSWGCFGCPSEETLWKQTQVFTVVPIPLYSCTKTYRIHLVGRTCSVFQLDASKSFTEYFLSEQSKSPEVPALSWQTNNNDIYFT